MMNANASALGIIFPNSYDSLIPDLVSVRLMASIPFASRYRLIDFVLSGMANCGIDNISVVVRNNYHSLMDHLGSGREWDLVRKNGGLTIFPPFADKDSKPYTGRVEALAGILDFLRSQKEKYVVLSDTNIAVNFDFTDMLRAHIASGADVTAAYNVQELPSYAFRPSADSKGFYYTYEVGEDGRINDIYVNLAHAGLQNCSMNIYVLDRELLISLISQANHRGKVYFERDVLLPKVQELKIQAYKYEGYLARITDIKSYFDENMKLLDDENLNGLFSGAPIYTKIRDDNPTRYISGAVAKNVMVADGCVIEGEIENCILFRGVQIKKGAKVKNCILMQDTVVEEGAVMDYVITDKEVTISAGKEMKGTDSFPLYIPKKHTV